MSHAETSDVAVRRKRVTPAKASVSFALLLAAWELYFYLISGSKWLGPMDGTVGAFTADRLGFNMAWLGIGYLAVQLLTIPFAYTTEDKIIGTLDDLASGVPFLIAFAVLCGALLFGKTELIDAPGKLEATYYLLAITAIDLLGGYVFNIALSRRQLNFGT